MLQMHLQCGDVNADEQGNHALHTDHCRRQEEQRARPETKQNIPGFTHIWRLRFKKEVGYRPGMR